MCKRLLAFFTMAVIVSLDTYSQSPTDKLELVARNLDTPWAIAFLPDSTLIFTERKGNVKTVKNGAVNLVGRIGAKEEGESGLSGIAVDPQFLKNRFIYVYYTYSANGSLVNRISRFTLNDTLTDERVLLDNIPAGEIHNGGGLRFGPDGLLYASTGDAGEKQNSQDIGSLGGKILRMKRDGSVPSDNPFGNYVYAYGLRDPQGFDWSDGFLYVTDHGPIRHDEVNIVEKGGEYGWPETCDKVPSFRCYTGFTLAPASCVAADGYLFITGLRGQQLRRINLTDGSEEKFFTGLGRLRALNVNGGYLYFGTSNRDGRGRPEKADDWIYRVKISDIR
jgi:hypothetical protein